VICPENENVALMRLNEVITEFIDKDLIACVHCAFGNDVAATISAAGENVEIMIESLRRRVDEKILLLADQSRKGEEKENFFLLDLKDLIILARDNVDVIAA
jgi:hypothetical protein